MSVSHPRVALLPAVAGISAVLLFAGCASPGEAPAPLLHAAANETRVGEEAYLSGRASDAVPALTEAVRLHFAAGDLPGASRALLNLALAQRGAGDNAAANATAARLREITPGARQQLHEQAVKSNDTADLDAAADWLEALLALDRGETAVASNLVSSSIVKGAATSPWPGRIETLRAEIALKDGHFDEALARSRAGQAATAAAHDRAEEARALRLGGAAQVGLAHWIEARGNFLAAIRIEEALGGGRRMAADLNQLAAIAEHLGDADDARLYAQRAQAILSSRPH